MPPRRTKPQTGDDRRLCVTLNRELEVEALVLRSLDMVPPRRRQEWLRGLLVAGFMAERRLVRDARESEDRPKPRPHADGVSMRRGDECAFSTWLAGGRQVRRRSSPVVSPMAPEPVRAAAAPAGKCFAYLQRVVGG